MRVLICDDVKTKMDTIERYLDSIGISEVKQVEYKEDVISEAKTNIFDLLILDMSMPVSRNSKRTALGGREILFELCDKQIVLPVIIMTQYNEFGLHSAKHQTSDPFCYAELYKNDRYGDMTVDLFCENSDEAHMHSIDGLHQYMCDHYILYVGLIYMADNTDRWKRQLKLLIDYSKEKSIQF